MTTIVVDKKHAVMCSDSKCTYGNTRFNTQKIFKMPDGVLLGIAGDVSESMTFIEWYKNGRDPDKKPKFPNREFAVLALSNAGIHLWDYSCIRSVIKRDWFAIGSGSEYALGAMRMGASAAQAVKVAVMEDNGSGLPVCKAVYVNAAKKKKVKKTARR